MKQIMGITTMIMGSNTLTKPVAPVVQAPPPSNPPPKAESQNASEKSTTRETGSSQPTEPAKEASAPPPSSAAPTPSAPPSESASRGAESRVVGNAVPQESAPEAAQAQTAAAPAESDRLKDMRAALATVTELAENPASDRVSQLFAATETNEATDSDGANAPADDPQSSIRSEQARESYATTRSLTEDKQAA